jgi:alanine racemase
MMPNNKLIGFRPTWAEINLDNLEHNFKVVKRLIRGRVKILVCVKADAYGHGLIPVAKRLEFLGVDWLGVASIDEGVALRDAGITRPILILGLVLSKDIAPVFKYKLTPTVCDLKLAKALSAKAVSLKQKISVHLKVDTGMGRIGVIYKDAPKLARDICGLKNVILEGVFTHLSCADSDKIFTLKQIRIFNELIQALRKINIRVKLFHTANSMATIAYPQAHLDMVRPGLMIYGLYPREDIKVKLKPVLSLKTEVVFVKDVCAGTPISYGRTYFTKSRSRVVTMPIGYGDGYPRNLSNKAPVLIARKTYRISGRVCMDQIMVDVRKAAVRVGEEVVLIGSQGANSITAEELAKLSGTISYEIVCGLGSRIPRVYV